MATKTKATKNENGIGKVQVRLLEALKKAGKPLTRGELAEKAAIDPTAIGNQAGYCDEAINKRAVHKHNLVNLGLVKIEWDEKESGATYATYEITKKGIKALAEAKAAK